MTTDKPLVSITISTRNRKEELLKALESSFAQTYKPLEVLVLDAVSNDGTEQAVREQFPATRYFRWETDPGHPAMRNRGFREAEGQFVISLDDDSYFTDTHTVEQIVEQMGAHPKAAVLALPFTEPLRPNAALMQLSDESTGPQLRTFVGCAAAIRKDSALQAGAYRVLPLYYKEDRDLSIRLLDRGWPVIYVNTPPICHLHSPKRDFRKRYAIEIRTNLLFDSLNIPHPYVLPRIAIDCVQLMLYKLTPSQILPRVWCIVKALGACLRYANCRQPVTRATYNRYRSLPSHGPVPHLGDLPKPASNSSPAH